MIDFYSTVAKAREFVDELRAEGLDADADELDDLVDGVVDWVRDQQS
jgi:hypothetical protein